MNDIAPGKEQPSSKAGGQYSPSDASFNIGLTSEDPNVRALRALMARPGFSIRARLIIGFLLLFLVSAGMFIVTFITLGSLEQKLRFLETTDIFTSEIQQARRYEKNYFLYGSELSYVSEHIATAERLLASARSELISVAGSPDVEMMERHFLSYKKLVGELDRLGYSSAPFPGHAHPKIEEELRAHGADMVSIAFDMSKKEREKVNRMFKTARRAPLAFLLLFVLLAVYESFFLSRHIIRRLTRLMDSTKRVAQGDFTPMTPHRRFRDEFTNLTVAMNSMMSELQHRHEILVSSHKLRAVGTLTAGIAHELNNPINNIMLTAEMFKEDYEALPDDERLEMLSDLVSQAERAQKIVRNLLDFARESEMESSLIAIEDIITETANLVGNQAKLQNVKLNFTIPENLPPVHGDRQLLSQVFLNLIMNSLDAMPGGGRLDIVAVQGQDPAFLSVEVSDTGKGISEHLLGSIFDPFFTTKPTGKGTGLGLSVSLGIVKKHGGTLKVRSEINAGTTFSVLIPVSTIPADLRQVNTFHNPVSPVHAQPPSRGVGI